MTKTADEVLKPCPICIEHKKIKVIKVDQYYSMVCRNCYFVTERFDSRYYAIKEWNRLFACRNNKEAEFLEELKKGCNELMWDVASKVPSRAEPTLENQFQLGIKETARAILNKIEQFQAQQKQVDDENNRI